MSADSLIGRVIKKTVIVVSFVYVFGLCFGIAQVFYEGSNGDNYIDQYDTGKSPYQRHQSSEYVMNDTKDKIKFRFNVGCVLGGILGLIIGITAKFDANR